MINRIWDKFYMNVADTEERIELTGCILETVLLARFLDCDCYVTKENKRVCARIVVNGTKFKVFEIHHKKRGVDEIYFNEKYLDKDLIEMYKDTAPATLTTQSGTNLMFNLESLPYEILREFVEDVMRNRRNNF